MTFANTLQLFFDINPLYNLEALIIAFVHYIQRGGRFDFYGFYQLCSLNIVYPLVRKDLCDASEKFKTR